MLARSRLAVTAVLFLGLSLLFMIPDGAIAGVTAGQAKPTTVSPKAEEAAKPAKTMTRKGAEPAGLVMKLDKQALKKLDKLPVNQRILVEGKETTVGQYKRELVREQKQSLSRVKAMPSPAPPSAEALQEELDRKDATRLQAANAKVQAEMAKLGKQPGGLSPPGEAEAIKAEALAIQNRLRAGNATPADNTRTKELWEQYQTLR